MGEMGNWSEVPHSKEVRPLNIPMGQVTVLVRVRLRSEGKKPEKMIGSLIPSIGSPGFATDSGRRWRALRFGAGPRNSRNSGSGWIIEE